MSKGGNNRDWGYASSNVDDDSDEHLTYTSYERSGSVNKYTDLGNGKHTHEYWKNKDDYNNGKDPDQKRAEESKGKNPSVTEVENNGGCYLTTACMQHMQEHFDDKCYELETLRWFRDKYVSKEDIKHYYETAPIIVEGINKNQYCKEMYNGIYNSVVEPCVKDIEQQNYQSAYDRYKNSILILEEQFSRPLLQEKFKNEMQSIEENKQVESQKVLKIGSKN